MDQLDRIEQRIVHIEEKLDQLNVDRGFELCNGIYVPKEKKDEADFWEKTGIPFRTEDVDTLAYQHFMQCPTPPPVEVKYKTGKKQRDVGREVQPKRLKRIHGK